MRALSLLALSALTCASYAQEGNVAPKVEFKLDKTVVAANKPVTGTVTITFATGLHGYQNPPADKFQIPITIKLKSGATKLVKVVYPKGIPMKMEGDEKPSMVYEGTIKIPVTIQSGTKSGAVVITFNYQQCTSSNCFPPSAVEAKTNLAIGKVAGGKAGKKG